MLSFIEDLVIADTIIDRNMVGLSRDNSIIGDVLSP